jgi:hypothetical protein
MRIRSNYGGLDRSLGNETSFPCDMRGVCIPLRSMESYFATVLDFVDQRRLQFCKFDGENNAMKSKVCMSRPTTKGRIQS